MVYRKPFIRGLVQQLQGLSIPQLEVLAEAVNESLSLRSNEIDLRKKLEELSAKSGVALQSTDVCNFRIAIDFEITAAPAKQKAVERKNSRFFWVAGDELIVISRKKKAEGLQKTGATIYHYDDLPAELKVKADHLLSARK
jgi:hypothetical protein